MADSNSQPNQTATQAYQFLDKMQALQEVSLELYRTTSLEELYRRAIELGRTRLGFDRLGVLLYDEAENLMCGAFGTDEQGNLRDERGLTMFIEDERLLEMLRSPEEVGYLPEVHLMDYGQEVGRGWNAICALWSGEKGIGWLATDNLLTQEPVSYHLDILRLYANVLGHIIERKLADTAERKKTEQDLFLHQAALETAVDAIVITDPQGHILWVNKAFTTLTQYEREEAIGGNPKLLKSGAHDTAFYQTMWQTLQRGQVWEGEIINRRKDGDLYPEEMSITPIKSSSGQITQFIAIKRDITRRKEAEALLRENQDRLALANQVVENSPVILFRWRADEHWSVEYVSENVARFGYTSEELLSGKTAYAAIVYPDDLARVAQEMGDYSASGVTQFTQEYRIVTKDGQVRWTDHRTFIIRDETGQITHYQGIVIDISERKQSEEELREREIRFGSLVSNIPGAVYRCAYDAEFTMYFLSNMIEEVTGYPRDDFIGNKVRSYASIVHPEDAMVLDRAILEGVEQRRAYSAEYRLLRADGSAAWVYEKGQAVYGEKGEVLWLDGAIFDVTERKRAEEMIAKRALELETVAEVSTAVSNIREPNELLQTVVDLTKSRFALYHAHIYLLNVRGDSLQLAAGAGEIGRRLVADGHSIPLDFARSLVAQAGRSRRARVVNNVRISPDWLPNPLLPDTQAEMAIPIVLGEQLLGVLDVQAAEIDYFTPEDERIQATLASQVAIALENARSFEQSQRAMQELNALTRQLTREGWAGYKEQIGWQEMGYVYDTSQVTPLLPVETRGSVAKMAVEENGRSLTQPLIIHGEPIGRLSILDEPDAAPSLGEQEAAEIIAAVAEQLSARLENLRLTEQTQLALAETAEQAERLTLLNQISQVISQTLERDKMLEAVYQQMVRVLELDAFHVGLYDPNAQTLHYPILYEAGERQPTLTVPLRPESNSYRVIHSGEAVLRHLNQEELNQIVAGQIQSLPGQTGYITASLLFAPLRAGQQMLGVISAQSYRQNAYTEADLQLLSGIASYVAVALENATLFANTQQRAITLQKLSEIETALSLAQTEDEIIEALISYLPQGNMLAATLGYFEQLAEAMLPDESPVSLASLWISGAFMPEMASQFQSIPLGSFASTDLWRENPYLPTLVADVLAESVTSARLREEATAQGWRSVVLLPLRSSGRWQGLISVNWSEAQSFSEDDIFLLNRLMEPIAAVVASRRAQLAQQVALTETEMLYTAGAALNAAQTYDDILTVIRQYTVADQAQSASLSLFDRAWTNDDLPDWIHVAAYFTKRTGVTMPTRFPLKHFPSAPNLLKAESLTMIEDIDDPDLVIDPNTRALYAQQFESKAVVFTPLVVAGQWIGYINVLYGAPRRFNEAEIRRLTALSTQAAVAIQNVVSVAETRARADELSVLNEMSRALATLLKPDEIIESIYHYTSQLLDTTNFYIALYDAQSDEVSFPYAVEYGERVSWPARHFGRGMTEYLLRLGRPLLVENNLQQWIERQENLVSVGQEAQSWLGVPMISGRQAVGVIVVQSEAEYQFNNNHLNLLSAIGSQTTIALQNARLFQQTQARAHREQILREITARVRGSADVETIMKTAVQEIGHTLGRKTMLYLGDEYGT